MTKRQAGNQEIARRCRLIAKLLAGGNGTEMARMLNIPKQNWHNYQSGEVRPSDEVLEILFRNYSISANYVLFGDVTISSENMRKLVEMGKVVGPLAVNGK